MDLSAEPPPPPDPNKMTLTPTDIPPDVPLRRLAAYPFFPNPDPIEAVPENYFPNNEAMGKYISQLRQGLQSLVQGPLDYRLMSSLGSWSGTHLGVQKREFDYAANIIIATLDAGPYPTSTSKSVVGPEDWGTLASTLLAAIGRGFTRPLKEVSCKAYTELWESLEDNPQRKLDDGEEPEFHSLLQRLKATIQQLDMHINADEADGIRQWATTTRKEIKEAARRAALAEVELTLHNWKLDQLTSRQKQLEDSLKKSILERNVVLLRDTAAELGLTIGDPATTPPS